MANDLILQNPAYDRVTDVLAFVKEMGRAIALSKMFGCETTAQGEVMALECMSRRMPPMMIAERYHLIFGKLSLKAEAMLADFRDKMGGSYRIIERTPARAAVELKLRDDVHTFEFTWEQAQGEPFIYRGKDEDVVDLLAAGAKDRLKLKAKYATPRARMQMLWARVVSDGVRALAPEVTAGSYTPEEIEDFNGHEGNGRTTVVDAEVVEDAGKAASGTAAEATTQPTAQPTQPTQATEAQYATAEQVTEIVNLLVELKATHEQQQAAMKKRGVNAWRSLTHAQAAELLAGLRSKAEASRMPPDATTATDNSPASETQIALAKQLIRQIAQYGDDPAPKIQAKLKAAGLTRLADLTYAEIHKLIQALGVKNLEAFFTASLLGHLKSAAPQGNSGN